MKAIKFAASAVALAAAVSVSSPTLAQSKKAKAKPPVQVASQPAEPEQNPSDAVNEATKIIPIVYSTCAIETKAIYIELMNGTKKQNEVKVCTTETLTKIIEYYKQIKPMAKTKEQKDALDNWRAEWVAAVGQIDTHPSETPPREATRANEKLKMAFE